MRRDLTAVVAAMSLVLILLPAPTAKSIPNPQYAVTYTIYYNCICGLCPTGEVIGEWTYYCDGTVDGWGQTLDTVDGWCITDTVSYEPC